MKLLTNISLALLLTGGVLNAQTVEIPDEAFRTCLMAKAPTAFDGNEDLILTEAPNITGFLNCASDGINSVEGFQYLTGIQEVNLSRNNITVINLPVNPSLSRLILDENQLTALPDLADLPGLKTLVVRNNNLSALPDLSNNTNLQQLYLENNALTALPDLLVHDRLWAINVSKNQLTSLPLLDSLKELKELVVANNQLTAIQSLVNLDSLTFLDFSGNQLTAMPAVKANNEITTIDLENNNFTAVPDFTVFPNLVSAFLNDNYLTFEALIQLTTNPGFPTPYPLNSQQTLAVGQNYSVREGTAITLSTGVDQAVENVTYAWYYEGVQIQSEMTDALVVTNETISKSGYYYCELTHPDFANLVLETDSFYVDVFPCFDEGEFTINVSPKTCQSNGGMVEVNTTTTLPAGFSYYLVAGYTADTLHSTKGEFTALEEPNYYLYGTVENCERAIGNTIIIESTDCNNVHISADGDGVDDFYYFTDQGKVSISDKFGNEVSTFSIPAKWEGIGNGQLVSPGLYYADINNGEKLIKITVVY